MPKDDRLVQGSIRVEKDNIFSEDGTVQHVIVSHGDKEGTLNVTTIPIFLREIFDETNISWKLIQEPHLRLKSKLDGINYDSISPDDDPDYLRMRFSGRTRAAVKSKLKAAFDWLDAHEIKHGEANGNAACIFECITNKQMELSEQEDN